MYDEDEGLRRARRPLVIQAYREQFRKDFTLLLKLRAQELVSGGRMVVSMLGTRDHLCITPRDTIFIPLNDMASRVCTFLSPYYFFSWYKFGNLR